MGIRETTEIIKHLETLPEDAMLGLFKAWLRVKLEQAFNAGMHHASTSEETPDFYMWFKTNYETK